MFVFVSVHQEFCNFSLLSKDNSECLNNVHDLEILSKSQTIGFRHACMHGL